MRREQLEATSTLCATPNSPNRRKWVGHGWGREEAGAGWGWGKAKQEHIVAWYPYAHANMPRELSYSQSDTDRHPHAAHVARTPYATAAKAEVCAQSRCSRSPRGRRSRGRGKQGREPREALGSSRLSPPHPSAREPSKLPPRLRPRLLSWPRGRLGHARLPPLPT